MKESAPRKRCDWAQGSDLLARYHDSEWGTPLHDDLRHFEFLLLDGAQAGLSWRTILNKRENYSVAFDSFNPQKISRYKDAKINKLLADEGIVRNRLKIHSAIKNARVFLQIQKEFGSFDSYVWRFTGGKTKVNKWKTQCQMPARTKESDALSSDLKKRGMSFVGTTIIYAYMQSAGMVNDHLVSCFRHKECE
ncbi:MAG: DNA-3-methyladenine glycosylase I [Candidatus Mycalebacterium zealandia]|nr:MAG: DNA-3-methyladenine glycosylase I [Candidatus Mycalebacterium zealandia]